MNKLRDKIEQYVLKAEDHWKVLPVERQRLLTKIFFGCYVLLTTIIMVNVCISTSQRSNTMSIDHIEGISKKPVQKNSMENDMLNSPLKK